MSPPLEQLAWRAHGRDCYIYCTADGGGIYAKVSFEDYSHRWQWQVACALGTGFRTSADAMDMAAAYVRTHPDLIPMNFLSPRNPEKSDEHERRSWSQPIE